MMHHVFGPHFQVHHFFPAFLIPGFVYSFWAWSLYFLKRDKQTEPQAPNSGHSKISETEALRDEIAQLKKENALLRELLKRDLDKK